MHVQLSRKARSLHARVAELKETSKKKVSKKLTKHRTASMEVDAEQASTDIVEHLARTAQLDVYLHELDENSDFMKCRNNVAGSQ